MKAADVINAAAKCIGKLRAGGGLSPSELNDGLAVLNALVDYWLMRGVFVYGVRQDEYKFTNKAAPDTNNPAVYTIGPSGADFTAARPTRIERANIILNDSTPGVFYPLEILDFAQWAAIRVEQLPVTLPTKMYCDYAVPNANLYFWGQPTLPYLLQLFTWQQVASFPALGTPISVPPGCYAAFLYTLAELVGPQWNHAVPEIVTIQARKARAGVAGLNSRTPKLATRDAGMPSSGRGAYFNYRTRGL